MKKIALSSLIALFAVSGANAATNHFVGGYAGISTGDEHNTVFDVAPEFGWNYDSNWDLGLGVNFGYDHDSDYGNKYSYGAYGFARYKVAQLGNFKVLLKGAAGVGFLTTDPEAEGVDSETTTAISAEVIPMVTYDLTEDFTLYANLNFLGVRAGYNFDNDKWGLDANADTGDVANTSKFQVGFTYNF